MNAQTKTRVLALLSALTIMSGRVWAQQAPTTPAAAPTTADQKQATDEMIELDPFTVSAQSEKDGYAVKDSLAGTRVRTDLRDIASSISVGMSQASLKDQGGDGGVGLISGFGGLHKSF